MNDNKGEPMSDEVFDAERFVKLAAALNGIELSTEQRPGVIINFKNFRSLHDLVECDEVSNPPNPLGLYRP